MRLQSALVLLACLVSASGKAQDRARLDEFAIPLKTDGTGIEQIEPVIVDEGMPEQRVDRSLGEPAHHEDQSTPMDQLSSQGLDAGSLPAQVNLSSRSADAPAALTQRVEGRDVKAEAVVGNDRCDPASLVDEADDYCSHVIETRAAGFAGRGPLLLSPEQKLLSELPKLVQSGSIDFAARRLGREGEPDGLVEEAIASTAYTPPHGVPQAVPKQSDPGSANALTTLFEAMANALPQVDQ